MKKCLPSVNYKLLYVTKLQSMPSEERKRQDLRKIGESAGHGAYLLKSYQVCKY